MALLVDLGDVPASHCDDCLEHLFKAISSNPAGDEAAIWRPHENPWLRGVVEDVTGIGRRALLALQTELHAALFPGTDGPQPLRVLRKAEAWQRPDDVARAGMRAALAARPPGGWTPDDWLLFCDLLIAEHLPDDTVRAAADMLAVRAALGGKIAAAAERAGRPIAGARAERLATALPQSRRWGMPPKVLTAAEAATLDLAAARALIFMQGVADDARKAMKEVAVAGIRRTVLGERDGGDEALRSRLLDQFGTLNRDWRRVAVTEAAEAHNSGFVGALARGATVRRVEAYQGACDFCRGINGRVFRVTDPEDPGRDGERDVWVGKTNAGRSASPRRREGGQLVERAADGRWWVAAGAIHPHCRGRWVHVSDPPAAKGAPAAEPDFMKWLDGELKGAGFS